jgi:hypothetical protein
MLPDAGSTSAWETFARPTGECQASRGFPSTIPEINQHSPLDRLIPIAQKKPQKTLKINKELKTNTQQRGWSAVSALEKGREARS